MQKYKFMEDTISTFHKAYNGVVEIKKTPKNYIPAGLEYVIVFQETLEKILTYDLNKTEMKVFIYILSQVKIENNLEMVGLQSRCSKIIKDYQANVSSALKKLIELGIIIREPIEFTKSYRYRVNYSLCAKDKGSEIKEKHRADKKDNPI